MQKKTTLLFKIFKFFLRLFYGKVTIHGMENVPDGDTVLVANHTQMHGPIAGELFLPDSVYIWCAGQMMKWKEVPAYTFEDFWSQKPKWTHPWFKLSSYLITPLCVCIFRNARTIPVYRDTRIVGTFRQTVNLLEQGVNILVFPEKNEKGNNILYKFQENFIDVAKHYYKRTGRRVTFLPMYVAPRMKSVYIGSQGVTYDPQEPMDTQRKRISACMFDSITQLARDLPEHTVVPYRNIPKRHYLKNKDVDKIPK